MGRVEYLNDPAAPRPNSLVPAAGVLAVDEHGRILLQRRRDTGQWAMPMGKQELGETVTQCAVRETAEETGITVEVTGLLGIYSDPGHVVFYADIDTILAIADDHRPAIAGCARCSRNDRWSH
jgi:8-oxo-dGTP pyrophosphatase MutT (NUDIX family)